MRICVLASGSKGNSTYVETKNHKILLDIGTNVGYIKERLEELGVSLNDIDTILISHVHSDHIGALENYIKKYQANVYMTIGMIDELSNNSFINRYEHLVLFDDDIYLDDVKIEVIKTSHNTEEKALDTIKNIFLEYGIDFENISCAKQNEKSEIIEL